MAKCCDRCKKPIDKRDMGVIKFAFKWRVFVGSIELAIQRKWQGVSDPDHYHKTATGKWELCEDCLEALSKFMLNE